MRREREREKKKKRGRENGERKRGRERLSFFLFLSFLSPFSLTSKLKFRKGLQEKGKRRAEREREQSKETKDG